MVTVIDADGARLGRLASMVAKRLLNSDESIVIINAEKAVITGSRKYIINRYLQKRRVGSARKGPYFPRMPDRIVRRTVRGMLPYQKPRGRAAYRRLRVYIGVPKEYEKAKALSMKGELPLSSMTVGELSRILGAKF